MASPWGKIETIETMNFADIMSEEYARGLQREEMKKCGKILPQDNDTITKEFLSSSSSSHLDGMQKDPGEKSDFLDVIPEDVLKAIKEDEAATVAAALLPDSTCIDDETCNSDALIAQLLQSQFDHEYNQELKRMEKQKNKDSKIRISLEKHRRMLDFESDEEDHYDDDDCDNPKRDWDRFETNEKIFEGIPKCGYKIDKEGEMITKHDAQICGVRNACRVMSFPPDFPTGDGAGFDMKLSNAVFNQLKAYSLKRKKGKMHDRKENIATAEMGVDVTTRLILYKFVNNQILEQINGIISTGKEALILHADSCPAYEGDLELPNECVIKVFKTTLNDFKQRDRYIKDDYRFKDRFSKQNNRVVISMWAEKEMHNLKRLKKCKINCPDPILVKKHVLLMSFLGKDNIAAPKLKDVVLSEETLRKTYKEIIEIMHKLYNDAKLVHADLSEYNILWYDGKCWIIDVAQAVEPEHPGALEFLMRDCDNIITFFTRRGLKNIFSKEQLFEHITGLNAESHNAAMLERIHTRGPTINEATAQNEEEVPIQFKPLPYPFETAWNKSVEEKLVKNDEKICSESSTSMPPVIETAEALEELAIHYPMDTKNEKFCEN